MSQFDPYHQWLGIPPNEQPENHYRLLGLSLFESDADVIDAAADRQMTCVQQCAAGEYVTQSQQLLNELSAARIVLLNADQKADYDGRLQRQLKAGGAGTGRSRATKQRKLLAGVITTEKRPLMVAAADR